jgi:uncharacterized membrane protein YbhN (UPF0104 family)
MTFLKQLLRPRVFIPLVLTVALLAFLLSFSNISVVGAAIGRIPAGTMALSFGLALTYLGLKFIQYRLFLRALQIDVTMGQLALAFAIGEIALVLPGGEYLQSYMLRAVGKADFFRSSAAAIAIVALEAGLALVTLLVLGIPAFAWLRPVVLAVLVLAALLWLAATRIGPMKKLAANLMERAQARRVGRELAKIPKGIKDLLTPRVMAPGAVLAISYFVPLLLAFFLIGRGVGLTGFTFGQAVTVYLFALVAKLAIPISSQLGVIEATGVGAMTAWGYDFNQAVAVLLGFRLLWTLSIWIVSGVVILSWVGLNRSAKHKVQEPPG